MSGLLLCSHTSCFVLCLSALFTLEPNKASVQPFQQFLCTEAPAALGLRGRALLALLCCVAVCLVTI